MKQFSLLTVTFKADDLTKSNVACIGKFPLKIRGTLENVVIIPGDSTVSQYNQ